MLGVADVADVLQEIDRRLCVADKGVVNKT